MELTNGQMYLIIGIWSLSLIRSILIMFGSKVFNDASMNGNSYRIPLLNLYSMLDAIDVSSYLGILFFIPVINLIPLLVMSIKLGNVYNCDFGFKMGLVFLPIVFYPSLFKSDKIYKNKSTETFSAIESAKSEGIDLINNEESNSNAQMNDDSPYTLDPVVDSIFKSKFDTMEPVDSYRASKIDKDVLDKISSLAIDDDDFKPIERQVNNSYFDENEVFESIDSEDSNSIEEESEKGKNVEFIDL